MFKRAILATAVTAALALVPGERVAMAQANPEDSIHAVIDKVNEVLEAQGAEVRLLSADVMMRGRSGHHGRKSVWRKRGFERADAEFVPFDMRRESHSGPANGAVDDITVAIDQTADAAPPLGGLTGAQTTGAIRRAVATWDSVRCSGLVLTEVTPTFDPGIIGWVLKGMPGGPFAAPKMAADILHAGFNIQDWSSVTSPTLILHDDIMAVTFTFVAGDLDGNLTDVDNNKKHDIIFQEIYYNPAVKWSIDNGSRRRHDDDDDDGGRRHGKQLKDEDETYDVQTVALHEMGHALSLEHYGKVEKRRNGRLDAKPDAVMNPVYTGTRHRLEGPDVAAHCIGGWKTWPRAKNNHRRGRDN